MWKPEQRLVANRSGLHQTTETLTHLCHTIQEKLPFKFAIPRLSFVCLSQMIGGRRPPPIGVWHFALNANAPNARLDGCSCQKTGILPIEHCGKNSRGHPIDISDMSGIRTPCPRAWSSCDQQ